MMSKEKEKVYESVEEENVKIIRLQFVDIEGFAKNVAIPISQLEKALESGISFDGSSIKGFVRIEESDMVLKPDPTSYKILPWSTSDMKEARIICDVYLPDGEPFVGCPRHVLRRNLEKAAEMGYTMKTGPELEFFLFEIENSKPTTRPHDYGGYFDLAPLDLAEDIRKNIVLALENMEFNIEASHHEVAFGQHEIDFKYDNALPNADDVITLKYVAKTLAAMHGLHATFMPKPIFGINGSGMHINVSLFEGNKNAFYSENSPEEISDTLHYFVGGLLSHIKAITAVTNPIVNSYKRLVPGYEAPVYISWSGSNRSSLVRVPAGRGKSTRIEIRSPDPSCNPYLAFSVILAAGIDGIKNKIEPPERIDKNIYKMTDIERDRAGVGALPSTLFEAMLAFKQDALMKEALGEHVFNDMIMYAQAEWDAYRAFVHEWEIDRYLSRY